MQKPNSFKRSPAKNMHQFFSACHKDSDNNFSVVTMVHDFVLCSVIRLCVHCHCCIAVGHLIASVVYIYALSSAHNFEHVQYCVRSLTHQANGHESKTLVQRARRTSNE